MKILVTGSNGFVGSNLAQELSRRGHQVIGLGRAASSKVQGIDYIQHDLSVPLLLNDSIRGLDRVVHCAALASPWARPEAFHQNNVVATDNLLKLCQSIGSPHFIYISSSSVFYRNEDQMHLTEDSPIPRLEEQINMYSRTKLMGEHLTSAYNGAWCILRPRAVFGPGDTVLLPRIIRAAERGKLPRLTRPDGQRAVGDLVYIDTLTHYIAKACEDKIEGIFNLTNDQPVEISTFVDRVLSQLGCSVPKKRIPIRLAFRAARVMEMVSRIFLDYREPPVTSFGVSVFAYSKTFDVRLARARLGPPKVSIDDGVASLVHWWKTEGQWLN
jgi:nucleoside-diphosphate-sugar epimerase